MIRRLRLSAPLPPLTRHDLLIVDQDLYVEGRPEWPGTARQTRVARVAGTEVSTCAIPDAVHCRVAPQGCLKRNARRRSWSGSHRLPRSALFRRWKPVGRRGAIAVVALVALLGASLVLVATIQANDARVVNLVSDTADTAHAREPSGSPHNTDPGASWSLDSITGGDENGHRLLSFRTAGPSLTIALASERPLDTIRAAIEWDGFSVESARFDESSGPARPLVEITGTREREIPGNQVLRGSILDYLETRPSSARLVNLFLEPAHAHALLSGSARVLEEWSRTLPPSLSFKEISIEPLPEGVQMSTVIAGAEGGDPEVSAYVGWGEAHWLRDRAVPRGALTSMVAGSQSGSARAPPERDSVHKSEEAGVIEVGGIRHAVMVIGGAVVLRPKEDQK